MPSTAKIYNVIVKFDDGIPHHIQGVTLLELERTLRRMSGLDCRVFKELKGDDSKLRVMMTQKQRDSL